MAVLGYIHKYTSPKQKKKTVNTYNKTNINIKPNSRRTNYNNRLIKNNNSNRQKYKYTKTKSRCELIIKF